MFGAMARKEGVTPQEFHDHYRHPHGTTGMRITTLREYVQSHQVDTELLGDEQRRFEAIAELWFDNGDDLLSFRTEPTMEDYLNEDETRFLDMKKTRMFIGEEEVLTSFPHASTLERDRAHAKWRLSDRPTSVKVIQLIAPEGADTWASDEDQELGRRLGVFRHVRCRATTPATFITSRKERAPDFVGAREMWWPTVTQFNESVAADRGAWDQLVAQPGACTLLAIAERWR